MTAAKVKDAYYSAFKGDEVPIMLVLLCIVCVVLMYPFERFLWKRICLVAQLKRVCNKKKYSLKILNHLFLFSGFKRRQSDFLIETNETVYSVKCVGIVFRKNYLKFIDDTHFAIRPLAFHLASTAGGVEYIVKEKPKYSFYESVPDSALLKDLVKIVLVCPAPGTLQYNNLNVGSGESIGEALCYTTSSFLKELDQVHET